MFDNNSLKARISVIEENINSIQQHNTNSNNVIDNNLINEMIDR